ncbi:ParB/RepB/Spo0J family partition protein [Bifidobacterium callimiconis]|uniref:ParB/RepB/Spo0J family partition protein n=1 Tax=Bifidobacterium callimiconis TaxID=2306973 RepID=UPI001BDBF26B|nr:ParB/RepB/Spo0J family partition protein [Bifidobacterium callimiconis]MBT1177051.1 ParB/RepB/Spo0J family partition protein [Bifidobacterium callimiconis]
MATRSRRLGKGLGALFPTIPDESELQGVPKPEPAPVAPAPVKKAERKAAEPVRPVVATPKPVADNKPKSAADAPKTGESGEGAASVRPAKRAGKSRRPSMPSLVDSVNPSDHPSDMFFGEAPSAPAAPAAKTEEPAVTAESPAVVEAPVASATAEVPASAVKLSVSAPASSDANDDDIKPVEGGYLAELQIKDIMPNEHQPRLIFDEDELMELSRSIQEVGVLQPIVVRRRAAKNITAEKPAAYELIMGERRMRASKLAGLTEIPAIVKTTSDDDMLRDALLENLHRVALNPLEEAAAYQQMLDEFGLTQEQLSKSVSKSRPQIANTLRLLQLPASVQKKLSAGVLSAGHARALLSLPTSEQMEALADRIIAEGLSVRSVEEIVATEAAKDPGKKKRKPRKNVWSDSDMVHSLENQFDTKVAIRGTKKKGRIEITFASEEDFDRIVQLLSIARRDDAGQPGSDGWV